MKRVEQPVTKPSGFGHGELVTTHPAFGMIQVNRVSGGINLFGSDFQHQNFIRLSIYPAELLRSELSYDRYHHSTRSIVEVSMSEAQWGTLISSLNSGPGLPCTLAYVQGEDLPALPPPPSRHDQFAVEMRKALMKHNDRLDELETMIEGSSLGVKAKDTIRRQISVARFGVSSSIDFVAKQFGEHMETVTESAKTEIEAYIGNAITRAGLKALSAEPPPITFLPGATIEHGEPAK